jgi:UrcA family protein
MATVKSLVLGLATIGMVAGPASATTSLAKTRSVSYADLDLSRVSGVQAFKRRIDRAIIAVCGSKLAGDAIRTKAVSTCRAETRAAMAPRVARAIDARAPRRAALEIIVAGR